MKLEIEEVLHTVRQTMAAEKINEEVIDKTLREIAKAASEIKEEEKSEKEPRERKSFGVLALETSDPKIQKGFVFAMEPDVESFQLEEKISLAAKAFNETKKGRKRPAKSISDTIETIANKFYKEHKIARKTKEAIYIVKTDNLLK